MTILTPPPDTTPTPLTADERDAAVTALHEAACTARLAATELATLRTLLDRVPLTEVEQLAICQVLSRTVCKAPDVCQAMVLNQLAARLAAGSGTDTKAEQIVTALASLAADRQPNQGSHHLNAALRAALRIARPHLSLKDVGNTAADLVEKATREQQAAEYGQVFEQVRHG